MSFENLREFIEELERQGELRRISAAVSPNLEITEILDRVVKRGGPALLFQNVTGYSTPIFANGFGSRRRIQIALGAERLQEITESFLALLDPSGATTFLEKLKMLPKLKTLGDALPALVKKASCQEVQKEKPSFADFPVLRCWPQDGGAYLTLPLVFTRDPETGAQNCGIYRMQIYDEQTSGMHWHVHKGGAEHFRAYKRLGQRMPVSVAVGCDPATVFCGAVPLPQGFDEMIFAGILRGKPVRMVKSLTNEILVPAEAEIVFEGYVEPDELRLEGPFGDHTGYYSLPDYYPVFHLTCVTHRELPIYHATVVGRPPMEDCYWGEAIEQLFLPLLKKQLPEIVDLHMPFAGVFHNLLLVAIRKSYPGHARKVMHALWGLGQTMFSKVIVVVDEGVNLRDYDEVAWRALNNIDPRRDFEFVTGPLDALDHAADLPLIGSKVGIDATRPWREEGFSRPLPDPITMPPDIKRRIDALWQQLGL
jgi:4-hydroxy-3-polyprenylbenzoate decarboxylase